jgi:hypothetical protein
MMSSKPRFPANAVAFFDLPAENTVEFKSAVGNAIAEIKRIAPEARALALYELLTELDIDLKEISQFAT